MRTLKDRVALVTGAASGIGRATSVLLAKKGCDLALADVDEKGLAETAKLVEAAGRKASTHIADVADRSRMEKLPGEVLAAHGHVHIVVNNAGVSVTAPLEEHTLDDFEWIVGINFWGVVYGCKFFLPHLKREEEGHIVNISSAFGLIGLPTQSSYCATKFAVRGFSESLLAEMKDTRVGVTCVHPGGINTNIVRSSRTYDDRLKARAIRMFERRTLPPEEAARRIVEGILKNKPRVLIARETYVIDGLKRLAPVLTSRLLARFQERMGL